MKQYCPSNSKYRSRKVIRNGITFHSVKEANRYAELLLLERAGAISGLKRQVSYKLIPAYYETINGKRRCVERECRYIADFEYIENGEKVVEDTKGFKTPEYIIKRKLMRYIHNIGIREI